MLTPDDFFNWDRRALPLPDVHFDTGPMHDKEVDQWMRSNLQRPPYHMSHPGLWEMHATAVAFITKYPTSSALLT